MAALPAGTAGMPHVTHAAALLSSKPKTTKVCKTTTKIVHGKKTRVKTCKTVKVTAKPKAKPTPTATASVPSGTFTGSDVNFRFGDVQVTVVLSAGKITDVKANANPDTPRSTFIDQQALPMLRKEVLQAQSANIDTVGGATLTSEAYIQSLQDALNKAGL
jgi:uncharacterized protein with FMN-binding domain